MQKKSRIEWTKVAGQLYARQYTAININKKK